MIADDHPIVAEGLARLLADRCEISGIYSDGRELLAAVIASPPDLAVVDVSMPQVGGFAVVRELRALNLPTKVILLTMHNETELMVEARAAGAMAFVTKELAAAELRAVVNVVVNGGTWFPALLRPRPPAETSHASLTPRQRDVLRLLARGLRVKEIASELGMSPRTVETHKYHIMEQLHLTSSAELVRYAIRIGLVER